MRVCYFGPYDLEYSRNRVVIKGLRKNGVEVLEYNSTSNIRLLDYIKLLKNHGKLDFDVVMLGARGAYYGQPLVPIMKKLTNKPIVFDAILTLYETQVVDRKYVNSKSISQQETHVLRHVQRYGKKFITKKP